MQIHQAVPPRRGRRGTAGLNRAASRKQFPISPPKPRIFRWLVIGAAIIGLVAVVVVAYALFPNQSIVGKWNDPTINFIGIKAHGVPGSPAYVVSYFYQISQTATLRQPRVHWKGTAWENRVTERGNVIARGFESALCSTTNDAVSVLAITNQVTALARDDGPLLLKTEWSYYSKAAVYAVDLAIHSVTQLQATAFPAEKTFLELMNCAAFEPAYSNVTVNRLRQQHLRKADSLNYFAPSKSQR